MQQDYIKDLEKNYQDLREFKHDYQNLLFSLHSYISEGDLEGLRSYYDQTILPTRQMMNLFPANLSMLDNMKVPEIRSLLSLKTHDGTGKRVGRPASFFLSQSNWIRNIR